MEMDEIQVYLREHHDEAFGAFQAGLIPTVTRERMIGVRTPILRRYAKKLIRIGKAAAFLDALPHTYFEEDQLHAFLLAEIKHYEEARRRVWAFLPYVDNWATCDQLIPKALMYDPQGVLRDIEVWLASDHTYTVRFGIGMLMRYFLDERFDPVYLEWVACVRSREYYVNMMIAWYFATALTKQYEAALPYLTEARLNVWVHNKTISKARDSYRVSDEKKAYLKTLRRRETVVESS